MRMLDVNATIQLNSRNMQQLSLPEIWLNVKNNVLFLLLPTTKVFKKRKYMYFKKLLKLFNDADFEGNQMWVWT